MKPLDFRSDTVTRPTPAMMEAMANARVGDDVYGEDPAVRELEYETALLLGKERALFVPSGTMANQLAIKLHTRPGESVIAEADAHCARFEAGAAAALSGVHFDFLPRELRFADAALERAVKPQGLHDATTSLVVVENSHNVGAGRVLDVAEMQRIALKARALGFATHVDGARLWNAAAALGVTERELVAGFDTVAVCFSKGLGAPVGSALCGPTHLIDRARKLRKMWGGAMRQCGYLAACALHGLRNHRLRLVEDHARASRIARALGDVASSGAALEVSYPDPGTNMVYVRFGKGEGHLAALEAAGLRLVPMVDGWLRAVTHLDVGDAEVEAAITILARRARGEL